MPEKLGSFSQCKGWLLRRESNFSQTVQRRPSGKRDTFDDREEEEGATKTSVCGVKEARR